MTLDNSLRCESEGFRNFAQGEYLPKGPGLPILAIGVYTQYQRNSTHNQFERVLNRKESGRCISWTFGTSLGFSC